ncbi:MAG: hypothetical protein H6Q14_3034, partial [Bacteroidetes bacterium]|nr:hypothetical protein [Bacteroidota bacterium]
MKMKTRTPRKHVLRAAFAALA